MVDRICQFYGAAFETYPSQIKKGGGRFCSRSCKGKNHKDRIVKTGSDNPSFKHGKHWSRKRRLAKEAWETKGLPDDVCEVCNKTIENPKSRCFHHIDHDAWNNVPENIKLVCWSCHMKEHEPHRKRNELGQYIPVEKKVHGTSRS